MKKPAIAIVGAGVSGLVCGTVLSKNGFAVDLFDKGRFAGGRLASRDRDAFTFDYGAQYFTARDPKFRKFLAPLLRNGTIARWSGNFGKVVEGRLRCAEPSAPRYVGVPLMRTLAEQLAGELNCRLLHTVTEVSRSNSNWTVRGLFKNENADREFEFADYDALVLNLPPAQAARLRPHSQLEQHEMLPCLALQIAFQERVDVQFDGIALDDELISWVARDSSKPAREEGERWVIHCSPQWSLKNYDLSPEAIEKCLIEKFATIFNITLPQAQFTKLQKWRFALPIATRETGCIVDKNAAVIYCGDWCLGPRIECAYLSGLAAAEEIIGSQRINPE